MNYKKSRNLAWELLIKHNINKLPVKVSDICAEMNIPIISYHDAEDIINKYKLNEHCRDDGFTFQNIIFYNAECTIERQRFTVAHELGHILLHNGGGVYNREPSPNDTPARFRAERLEKLYKRENEFFHKYNKSCFLLSPLERQVYNNFLSYINDYKSSLF